MFHEQELIAYVSWLSPIDCKYTLFYLQATVGQEVLALKHTLLVVLTDEESDPHQTTFTFTKKGGELSLDCSDLEGDGREVDWTKQGSGNINKMIVSPPPLTFTLSAGKARKQVLVDKEGSGVYYCSVTGSTHVSRLAQHVPEVTSRVRHVYTAPGRGARLECLVSAAPVPAVTWTRVNDTGGAEMVRSGENTEVTISDYTDGVITSSLVLDSVTETEAGEYVCSAVNIHGKVSHQILENLLEC